MGSDRLGSGSLAAIFCPLQSPVPRELRPVDLRSLPARHDRNGGWRPFVSSMVSGRCLTGLVPAGGLHGL